MPLDHKDFKATLGSLASPASLVPWVPAAPLALLASLVTMAKLENLENLVKGAFPALRAPVASREPQAFLVSKVTEATQGWTERREKLALRA